MKKLKKVLNKILILGVILNLIFAVLVYVYPARSIADGAHFQGGNFFLAANVTQNGGWQDPVTAAPGEIINYKAQILNDGNQNANNVQVKADFPTGLSNTQIVNFRVKADNAVEATDNATVNVTGSQQRLDYLPGHAFVRRPPADGVAISPDTSSNNISTQWINIGTVSQGEVVEVLFKAGVSNGVPYSIYLEKKAANLSCPNPSWSKTVAAAPGQIVQFHFEMRNTSIADVTNLLARDVLPTGLAYTNDPVKVTYPSGQTVDFPNALSGGGINVGTLAPYSSSTVPFFEITFKTVVQQNASGAQLNVGQLKSDQTNWLEDTASVNVGQSPCYVSPTPTPTPTITPTPTPTPTITPTPTVTLTPSPTPTNVPGNNPPVCDDLSVNPSSGGKGLGVTLRGRGHHDSVNGDYINFIRFDYGDGTDTKLDQNFGNSVDYSLHHTYNNEGNYTARFWLRDSVGAERGGDGNCAKTVSIFTTKPSLNVVEQPRTGGEAMISLIMAGLGGVGLLIRRKI